MKGHSTFTLPVYIEDIRKKHFVAPHLTLHVDRDGFVSRRGEREVAIFRWKIKKKKKSW